MAQPAASPTPNVLKPAITVSSHLANPLFYPRKEFLRDHPRVVSSFTLLTLAGPGFVRLYSFPDSVIQGLRRLFKREDIVVASVRENPTNHFFEFYLDHKPWSNVRSLVAEKLVVAILSVIFQFGFAFLSTIEYGRESDDRIALAFSRPAPAPANSSIPAVPNASVITLPQTSPMLFAISFPSNAILRVIEPPLPLTPAILQAVRNAWPRGIASEKKIGDTYEFKLEGYRWYQEDTSSVDSLQQILSLLSALDRHGFALLTSLTLGDRSRKRDLWIFSGPVNENHSVESPPASPTGSSLELKREGTLYPGSPPEGLGSHIRSLSPHMSSPLKQVTPSHSHSSSSKLRKPFPKAQLPLAFQSESSLNDTRRLPSEVGSVDMTGVGTGLQKGITQPPTSDVFYTTGPLKPGAVYQQEFNPWNRSAAPPANPPTAQFLVPPFGRQHSRHYSMSSTDDPMLRASTQDSPYDIARQSSSSNGSRARRASSPLAGAPLNMFPQPLHVSPSADAATALENGHVQRHSTDGVRPNSLTPPLLGGAFRDSTFSSSTGFRSTEIPITWTGKDPEPSNEDARLPLSSSPLRSIPIGPRERRASGGARTEFQTPQSPQGQSQLERRGSSGPALPGAWASISKEQDDVAGNGTPPLTTSSSSPNSSNMIPPTIKEQPSQEGEEVSKENGGLPHVQNVKVARPHPSQPMGEGARKSEAAWVGNTMDRLVPAPNGTAHKVPLSSTTAFIANSAALASNGHAQPKRPDARRANSISEGWVIINVDGKAKASNPTSPSFTSGQSALRAPPLKHQRSFSDSRIPTAHTLAQTTAGAGKSTMSPAAKAIVMVDAIGVKETAKEKTQSGGKLRRLLGRSSDKSTSHIPEASTSSTSPKGKAATSPHPQSKGMTAQASPKGSSLGTVKGRK